MNPLNFDNCFGLVLGDAFSSGEAMLEMLIRVNLYCMDVCGLRLCWLTKEEFNTATISATFTRGTVLTPISIAADITLPLMGRCFMNTAMISAYLINVS